MKEKTNIILVEPSLQDYWYEQQLLSDSNTMNYNAGYDVSYNGYHYDSGCIDFPKSSWEEKYAKRNNDNKIFFAYIKDKNINKYVGYVNYYYNNQANRYECGIVIEYKYRSNGYSKIALKLLCEQAFKNNIESLYDNFEVSRISALKLFQDIGFKIVENTSWKRFNQDVEGVIICLNKDNYQGIGDENAPL